MYVISCRGIVAADSNGKSDPYVEIEFAGKIMKTIHREDETNPQFDEIVDFGRNKRSSSFFTLRVYDRDDFGEPDLLGTTIINFSEFENNNPRQSKFIFGKNDLRRFVTYGKLFSNDCFGLHHQIFIHVNLTNIHCFHGTLILFFFLFFFVNKYRI